MILVPRSLKSTLNEYVPVPLPTTVVLEAGIVRADDAPFTTTDMVSPSVSLAVTFTLTLVGASDPASMHRLLVVSVILGGLLVFDTVVEVAAGAVVVVAPSLGWP